MTRIALLAISVISALFGVTGIVVGFLTGTTHNVVIGLIFLAVGYANYYEEREELSRSDRADK